MNAMTVERLSHAFGSKQALDDVSLEIPSGCVFGLLGLNGAGKTTLLHHCLGLLRPHQGRVEVLGGDPIVDRETVLRRVGYLSETDALPAWMSVAELLRFAGSLYPTWDSHYAAELCDWFELSLSSKMSSLSKGVRARVGLVMAIAHRPELLILDEPSSGLDPIARADILEAIIRTVSLEGRTVIFSSHLLGEVHRVCDRLAVLHEGRVKSVCEVASMSETYREWILRPKHGSVSTGRCPLSNALDWQGLQGEWSAVVEGSNADSAWKDAWELVTEHEITLDRLFLAWVGKSRMAEFTSPTQNANLEAVS
ncbi:MAG: ATP-binding cassette domain-containing protein [Planctomycetota bacterium]